MPMEYNREPSFFFNFSLVCLTRPALHLIQISVSNPVPPLVISDGRVLFQLLGCSLFGED